MVKIPLTIVTVKSLDKPLVSKITFYHAENFKISFTGLSVATRALSSVFYILFRIIPQIPLEFFKSFAQRAIQDYLNNENLPF